MASKLILLTLFVLFSASFAQRYDFMDYYDVTKYSKQEQGPIRDTKADVLNFALGFLEGVGSASLFDDIRECVTDTETIAGDIETAFNDIKTKKPAEVKAGIQLLGDAAQIIPKAMTTCKAGINDIPTIIKMINTFKDPVQFLYYVGKSLIINHVEVIKEVDNAISAYDNHDYTQLGYWVGKTMDTILLKQTAGMIEDSEPIRDTNADVLNFALGFLEGVGSASLFDNIRECVTDAQSVANDLDTAFNDIKTKSPSQVKAGLQLIGDAAQIVPTAIVTCKAAGADIPAIIKMIDTFKNPVQFLYYVGKSLIINHVEVIKEVDNAISAYDNHDFTQLGYWVGKTMDTIVLKQSAAVRAVNPDIIEFAKGFLQGVSSASAFDEIKACLTDSETFGTEIYQAVEDIRTKNPSQVKQGIALLGQAAKLIPTAAETCKAAGVDVETLYKLIQTFQDPESFLYYIGKELLINHVEVIKEVTNAVTAYDNKDWETLGYWVGAAMDTIILGEQLLVIKTTQDDILNFAKGFLQGVASASAFDEIKTCLADSDTFGTDIYQGVQDIITKNPANVKAGIALLGQAAQIVPTAAEACKAAGVDVQTLYKLVQTFQNPESFLYYIGKSLLINHVEVIKEITNAVTAYQNQDYQTLGYWVGAAMDTIILGQSTVVVQVDANVVNFVKGFFEGIASASVFDEVKTCITDSDTFGTDIYQAVQDIKTKNPAEVKQGIALLGQAAQIVPTAVKTCKAAGVDLETLTKMITSFTNPTAFLYYIGKSLLINHVEIIQEVNSAVQAYDGADYEQLGFWVGKALDSIILGEDQGLTQDFVDHLNKVSGWTAAIPAKFEGMTYREIKNRFLGALPVDYSAIENITVFDYEGMEGDLPAYFNASQQWPGCVHPIRDQGQCGSCWAFAASESLSDRFCIASNGSINVVLSPQYLLSCNNILDHGCNGGVPLFSWWFITSDGLVTDSCLPYASYNGTQPITCKQFTQCADGSTIKKYYGKKDSTVQLKNPASIQANLFQYGPVEAAMTVYQDFMAYSGGIYTHTSGSELGGHAIKIVGWGNENGTNYWIVANSWGPNWGENGFFRIAFGQCGIDSACVAGQADISKAMESENKFW